MIVITDCEIEAFEFMSANYMNHYTFTYALYHELCTQFALSYHWFWLMASLFYPHPILPIFTHIHFTRHVSVHLLCFIRLPSASEASPKNMDKQITWIILGQYSPSWRTSCRKISWSLQATTFGFRLFQSLWNLTGTSAAALRSLYHPISRLRYFTRSCGKTSYRPLIE